MQFGDLVFAPENRSRSLGIAVAVQVTARVNAVPAQQIAGQRDEIATRMAVLNLGRGRGQIGRNEGAAQQRLQEFFHRRLALDHCQGMNDFTLLQPVLNRIEAAARRHFALKKQLLVVGVFQ